MTEDQIERRVEAMFDALDAWLTSGGLTQAAYDKKSREIDGWAERQYRFATSSKEGERA